MNTKSIPNELVKFIYFCQDLNTNIKRVEAYFIKPASQNGDWECGYHVFLMALSLMKFGNADSLTTGFQDEINGKRRNMIYCIEESGTFDCFLVFLKKKPAQKKFWQ
jgi:hypothetical protein